MANEKVPDDAYRKFFWIVVTTCVGFLFSGAMTFFVLKANVENQTKLLDELKEDVKKLNESKYTTQQAAQDRVALLEIMSSDKRMFSSALDSMQKSWLDLMSKEIDENRRQSEKITELLMFKARLESK